METETYNPTDPIFYNYKGLHLLDKNMSSNYTKVYVVAYMINTDGKHPFLEFLLEKNTDLESNVEHLNFLEIDNFLSFDKNELVDFSKLYLHELTMTNYDEDNQTIEFKGFFHSTTDLYLFFDTSNTYPKYKLNDIYRSNRTWFGLIDEIVNHRHLCNIPIHRETTSLFLNNNDFCFLLDKNNESYEIPVVSYVGKKKSLINFTYTFGQISGDYNDIFGPYYYFTDYANAIKNHGPINEVNNDGIVRFAIFTGMVKYVENNVDDPCDNSDIKKKNLTGGNQEHLTMRITDYDGVWTNNYDSIYLGHIELDNGSYFSHNNLLVVKDYNQQVPLSYHFIDKKTLEKDKSEYLIL